MDEKARYYGTLLIEIFLSKKNLRNGFFVQKVRLGISSDQMVVAIKKERDRVEIKSITI